MNNKTKEFLRFNGHDLYFTLIGSEWWIALKPICEAFKVNWNRQFQNLKDDVILSDVFAKQQMRDSLNKQSGMVSLPEFYIYGWLFQIRSGSKELSEYKWECYRILYNHFKGTITKRKEVLKEFYNINFKIQELDEKLLEYPEYLEIQDLKKQKSKCNKELKIMDEDLVNNAAPQGDLFEQDFVKK